MKYIDADQLREKITDRLDLFKELSSDTISPIRIDECKQIIDIIDSLQQEQRETDGDDGKFVKILVRKEFAELFQKLGDEIQAGQSYFVRAMNQQGQPKKSKKDCNDCPHCVDRKDQYGWHFKGCFGGPYKGKFIAEIDECPLKQEQPEVELEKEYKTWWNSISGKINVEHIMEYYMHETARHFYELGKNSKKYDTATQPKN